MLTSKKPRVPGQYSTLARSTKPMARSSFGPRKVSPFKKTADLKTTRRRAGIKKKGRPAPTAAEQRHMDAVARMGCIVCRNLRLGETPCEIHHVRFLVGGGQRAGNLDVLGLCPPHHRSGGHGVAYHAGPETWEENFGTERELLEQTKQETGLIQLEAS